LLKSMREEHIVYSVQVQAHWLFLPTKLVHAYSNNLF
jgi:hypothetical protein